ncbi:hypothetical protein KQI22_05145 [Kineothrix sp. MSJ-39]|uniref:hypothetical protein n=1 Tax=Kineothrix sp. MSJ-39 TaxID=2841533 RepID=UPI001C124875|nr:hypothetical protein [Kineothrix sp. MSJ-39]MBU5429459.1 hypothetical protein [Kineothrix sp. MSJ-39]
MQAERNSKSPISEELYDILQEKGYSQQFSELITRNLNTDFTAGRMIGYLSHYTNLPEEEIVDEMLAILSDRNRIMQKKGMEQNNAKWNQMKWEGLFAPDEKD